MIDDPNDERESELIRRLSAKEPIEPPTGLLSKLVGEIPASLAVAPEKQNRFAFLVRPASLRLAAMLILFVGAGYLATQIVPRVEPQLESKRDAPLSAKTHPASPAAKPERQQPPASATLPNRAEESKSDARRNDKDESRSQPLPFPSALPQQVNGPLPAAIPPPAAAPPAAVPAERDNYFSDSVDGKEAPAPPAKAASAGGTSSSARKKEEKPERTNEGAILTEALDVVQRERAQSPSIAIAKAPPTEAAPAAKSKSTTSVRDAGFSGQLAADKVSQETHEFQETASRPLLNLSLPRGAASSELRKTLAGGRLPAPGSVSRDEFLTIDSVRESAGARIPRTLFIEGAPSPYSRDGRYVVLFFEVRGAMAAEAVEARLDFNPEIVARHRLVGRSLATVSGDSFRLVVEAALHHAPRENDRIATFDLISRTGSFSSGILSGRHLVKYWEKATPELRSASLGALLSERLEGLPAARRVPAADLVRRAKALAKARPDDPGIQALSKALENADGKGATGGFAPEP